MPTPPRWPAPCLICRTWAPGGLCAACLARFAPSRPRCKLCGLALAGEAKVCAPCLLQPPPVAGTIAAVDYGFPWADTLAAFKFGGQPELARALAWPLAQAVAAQMPDLASLDWVLPVPLWRGRLAERGYNQSWELARHVARALKRPGRHDLLQRWRSTQTQSLLPHAQARQANLAGAFIPAPGAAARLQGRRVAVVDDVMTTGATVFEVARTLRQAGAAEVWLWVLARTPPER